MKRVILCLFALCLLAGACGQIPVQSDAESTTPAAATQKRAPVYAEFPDAPAAFDGMGEAALQPYFELAQEAYKRYIIAVCFSSMATELPEFPLRLSPLLQKYTELRFAAATKVPMEGELLELSTYMADGWMGDAWMRKWKVIDGKLLCNPCVEVTFHYSGEDTESGFGSGVQMLIENPQSPVLADWFENGKESWDRGVREGHYDLPEDADPWTVRQWPASWNLSDPENWLGNCKLLPPADKIFE